MTLLRQIAQLGALIVLLAGPILILLKWGPGSSRISGFLKYVVGSVIACTAVYWLLFYAADSILDVQFRKVVPNGEWTDADELAWTDADRRVVAAHFGDGARNVFALFAPVLLLANSIFSWVIVRGFRRSRDHRAA
jgi:hypothetical protein